MLVREATLADYPGFAGVAREVHEHHVAAVPDVFQDAEVIVPEAYFAELVTGEDSAVYVAECDGALAGYAVLFRRQASRESLVPRTVAYIDNVGVAKAYRRQGVGRQLMEACAAWARAQGATSLELECWEANQEAIAFYASMGLHLKRRWLAMDL